ncbi:hypothetical protein G3O00_08515 [Burkholderia sp. Ac-20384]|uniref:hypothetical protein n=1 Tax=Burkholderia sp. Ac-20384 TaxID=2703902 RepID=UPI00197D1911|nr:hypothetical protein [Burkholderia sp. Ac-20384]MBN3823661.1 hypothetical protein [Burkholderia sp. Ac-20384]
MNLNTYEIEVERTTVYSGVYRVEAESKALAKEYLLSRLPWDSANLLIEEDIDSEEVELKSVKFICR